MTSTRGWVAGLYEGEGSALWSRKGGLCLSIGSTDLDTLERFQRLVGGGCICGPYKPNVRAVKPYWLYRVQGRRAYATFVAMWGLLGARRREQVAVRVQQWIDQGTRGKYVRKPK